MKIKIITCLIALLGACKQLEAQRDAGQLPPLQFKAMVEKTHGIVIDVRGQAEYNFKHIPDAINIDVESENFKHRINDLDKNKNYFVYCGIAKESELAISIMKKEGFKKLYSLKGGFLDWKREGLPVIKYK
jgi:rhodanese-related sulfurtransferase